jgi:hypothetical protein
MTCSPLRRLVFNVGIILLSLSTSAAFAHGGVVEEDDLCVINIGYLRAHFKIYVPERSQHEQYCEDIPIRGDSVFVMEYQHDGLSSAEIDFRIIRNVTGKGTFARIEHVEAIDDLDAITIRYEPPTVVPDVFTMLQPFEEDGEYIGIVSARQMDTQKVYTAVFPFEVGYTGVGYWPWILGGMLVLQLNYWYMNRRRGRRTTNVLVAVLACTLFAPDAIAQEDEVWKSDAGHFIVSYKSELQPLTINKIHNWILHVEDGAGNSIANASITVEGGMPEHNHGLPTAPAVTAMLEDGDYRVEGIRFHMRGYWEIRVSIGVDDKRDNVTIPLQL